jgi:hypothetical protein
MTPAVMTPSPAAAIEPKVPDESAVIGIGERVAVGITVSIGI